MILCLRDTKFIHVYMFVMVRVCIYVHVESDTCIYRKLNIACNVHGPYLIFLSIVVHLDVCPKV